jgi:hypothetical protein
VKLLAYFALAASSLLLTPYGVTVCQTLRFETKQPVFTETPCAFS